MTYQLQVYEVQKFCCFLGHRMSFCSEERCCSHNASRHCQQPSSPDSVKHGKEVFCFFSDEKKQKTSGPAVAKGLQHALQGTKVFGSFQKRTACLACLRSGRHAVRTTEFTRHPRWLNSGAAVSPAHAANPSRRHVQVNLIPPASTGTRIPRSALHRTRNHVE